MNDPGYARLQKARDYDTEAPRRGDSTPEQQMPVNPHGPKDEGLPMCRERRDRACWFGSGIR